MFQVADTRAQKLQNYGNTRVINDDKEYDRDSDHPI